ncbi:MAG: ATP-binding protein, partial [Acidobacteriota bacterium]
VILATSNPSRRGTPMLARQDLHELRGASPLGRVAAIMEAREDYETRVALAINGQKTPVFTIQVLVLPALLRAATVPALQQMAAISVFAMALAFAVAFWSAQVALRPLARISHLIDDIAGGKIPAIPKGGSDEARELALIESKLNLLGERFRDAKEDASQLRLNLEGALEKLDAGTRRHIEGQLAVARRLTAINSLTSQVAHEIKNPLNSISLRLELLRSRVSDEAPDTDAEFAILSEEVTRLDRVVRTFLDFNRPVELKLEQLDVVEAARDALLFLEPEAADLGIKVIFSAPEDPALVQADPGLLRQALVNIAVNAIEAMKNGGELRLVLRKTPETCIIRIEDTGPGIPKEQLARVFQLYFTTKPRGTGIGLAMAFRAIQLHGGTIEVESERGRGTTFLVILPLAGVDRAR